MAAAVAAVAAAAATAAAERKQWSGSGSSGGVVVVAAAEVAEDFSLCHVVVVTGFPRQVPYLFSFLSWYVDACLKKCYWDSKCY